MAWYFGARFDNLWKSDKGYNWSGVTGGDGSSAAAVPSIEHPEL